MANEAQGEGSTHLVSVDYELTRQEVVSVVRWQLLHVSHIRRDSLWGLLPIIGGTWLVFMGGMTSTTIGWIGISFGVLAFLFSGLLYYVGPVWGWRTVAVDGVKRLEITDEGVQIHSRNSDITHRWGAYSEIIETDEMFLLRLGKRNTYTFVPRRALRSPSDELEFRSLAERNIAPRSQGIPASG